MTFQIFSRCIHNLRVRQNVKCILEQHLRHFMILVASWKKSKEISQPLSTIPRCLKSLLSSVQWVVCRNKKNTGLSSHTIKERNASVSMRWTCFGTEWAQKPKNTSLTVAASCCGLFYSRMDWSASQSRLHHEEGTVRGSIEATCQDIKRDVKTCLQHERWL